MYVYGLSWFMRGHKRVYSKANAIYQHALVKCNIQITPKNSYAILKLWLLYKAKHYPQKNQTINVRETGYADSKVNNGRSL